MKTELTTMKKSFLLLLLICFNIKLFGQNLDWVKTINCSFQYGGYMNLHDVCIDDNNKQYSISYPSNQAIFFDYNPTGNQGSIIIKSNPSGSSEWYKSFSGNGSCNPKKILYNK